MRGARVPDQPLHEHGTCQDAAAAALADLFRQQPRAAGPVDTEAERRRQLARSHIRDFTLYTKPDYQVTWYHDALLDELEEFARGNVLRMMIFLPFQRGKALAVDTPIPTPHGWQAMGSLDVGSRIFGDDGRVCNVIARSPHWCDRPVWEVADESGCSVLADAEHLWRVRLCNKWPVFKLKTTAQLAARTFPIRPMVERQGILQLPAADLPIDPYVLGVWLGDGTAQHATITQGDQDVAFVRSEIERAGFRTSNRNTHSTFGVLGLQKPLRQCGLLRNKHIPRDYLRGSAAQRIAILQGLIDTDGYVYPDGRVEFTSTNIDLARGVRELVFSLGCKASWGEGRATVNGKDCGPKYRVQFYRAGVARLPRKAERCRNGERRPDRYLSFRPGGTADTVCIQVDSPTGMFLCGPGMLPTHNSELSSRRLPAYMLGQNPDLRFIATSYGAGLAATFNREVQRIIDSPAYQELFPETRLFSKQVRTLAHGNWLRNSDEFEIVGHQGFYKCAGVGGGIAGRPGDVLSLDDVTKDRREAESSAYKEFVKGWYQGVLYGRRSSELARILVTMTRWTEDDLAGWLLAQQAGNPKLPPWRVVRFPELAEPPPERPKVWEVRHPRDLRADGDPLWPERYSREDAENTRDIVGPVAWASTYQQRPSALGGAIFQRSYFRYFSEEQAGDQLTFVLREPGNAELVRRYPAALCRWFQTVDTALTTSKASAYTAVLTFALTPGRDLLVFHAWRARVLVPEQFHVLVALRCGPRDGNPPQAVEEQHTWPQRNWFKDRVLDWWPGPEWPAPLMIQAVEKAASGFGLIQQGAALGFPITELKASKDKTERVAQAATMYRCGKVWHREGAGWLTRLEDELLTFPNGAFKDQGDCVGHAGLLATQDELMTAAFSGELALWPDAAHFAAQDKHAVVASIEAAGAVDRIKVADQEFVLPAETEYEWWEG